MILLNPNKIHDYLNKLNFKIPHQLYCFTIIDSTNRFLNDLPETPLLTLCCAEEQTAGRGRFSRHWHSPFGENIYFSGRWRLATNLQKLSGLSLVIALAIIESLKNNHINEKFLIKWPNDLFWQHKKFGGILIELGSINNDSIDVTIGIGLNVNTNSNTSNLCDRPWCSMLDITGNYFDRNILIADLIVTLNHYVEQFLKSGFTNFQADWGRVDYLKNQWINVTQGSQTLSGYASGVNAQGLLCLKDKNNVIHYVTTGEATICVSGENAKKTTFSPQK